MEFVPRDRALEDAGEGQGRSLRQSKDWRNIQVADPKMVEREVIGWKDSSWGSTGSVALLQGREAHLIVKVFDAF